jgi:hypothetical protein
MSASILCLCCPTQVAALQRADLPSNESYRVCKIQETEVERYFTDALYFRPRNRMYNTHKASYEASDSSTLSVTGSY